MKLIFAADTSFNYMQGFPGKDAAIAAMREPAELFSAADFSMVNLENIFGEKVEADAIPKCGPNLISEDGFIEYIHALNPTVVGLANNHTMDYSANAFYHTADMLKESGYLCIGAGANLDEAYRPAILEKDGVKVAVFAVCENEFGGAKEDAPGTACYQLGRVSHAIMNAQKDGLLPIIYFHGGNETNPFPSPGKVELYRHFIDMGAEAVIAMHTHCPQGYEMYCGKPIVYSMGNFFFPAKEVQKSWHYGYMSELNIENDKIQLTVYPYRFDDDKITVLQGKEKEDFLAYLEVLKQPIDKPKELQAWFDSWCLIPDYLERLAGFEAELFADGKTAEIVLFKNVFGCEAHNELLTNTMCMIYEERVEAAKPRVELIQKLRNMECI